ncbi:decarboxylase [Streptomyces sp. WY228]|uniref:decarboxylase n=1 Tax=Streptomyces sp. WY228 TaxID=2855836 RepID=UPI001C4E91AB|nr:decarboxylase [Streptomyces sp. WY228]QXQ97055.1 decarboxylase [Streptomyces sp. WY228]
MTTVGLLYPGHAAEDDFPRIEILLDTDIRLPLFSTETGEDAYRPDALREQGAAERIAEGVEELRLGACGRARGGSFAGPASTASATRYGAAGSPSPRPPGRRVGPPRLESAGIEVVAAASGGAGSSAEAGSWGPDEVKRLVREADHPDAEVVLVPDTALHTAAYVPELEELLGKPVLTANQVTVWEGLRLADRRTWAPTLGTLFATREPVLRQLEPKGIEVRE